MGVVGKCGTLDNVIRAKPRAELNEKTSVIRMGKSFRSQTCIAEARLSRLRQRRQFEQTQVK